MFRENKNIINLYNKILTSHLYRKLVNSRAYGHSWLLRWVGDFLVCSKRCISVYCVFIIQHGTKFYLLLFEYLEMGVFLSFFSFSYFSLLKGKSFVVYTGSLLQARHLPTFILFVHLNLEIYTLELLSKISESY